MRKGRFGLLSTLVLVWSGVAFVVAGSAGGAAGVLPVPTARMASTVSFGTPPTTADCEAATHLACYSPQQMETAYDMDSLYGAGYTGQGKTIVIVDSYGYQNIGRELQVFDRAFGLPAPPHFTVLQPAGPVPPFNAKTRPMMVGWAQETSLDVEWSHAMAPGANILLVETPVPETLGVQGFPQIVQAENYVIAHHLGDVITQSFAAPEPSFPSPTSIMNLRSAYVHAAAAHISVLAGAGDEGPSGATSLTPQGFAAAYYLHRVAEWPADDPLVTGVGGTQLFLNADGTRWQPDAVWNDTSLYGSPAAGAGGLSTVFSRPAYQNSVKYRVGNSRGFPDVSLSAAVNGAALVYLDAAAAQGPAGFYLFGGTSEASPLLSGIVAIADEYAGHDLGLLNPALYRMAAAGDPAIVDLTAGTNTVTFPQNGATHTVRGWDAVKGYDLASGLGTVDGAHFVQDIASFSTSS